MFSIRTTTGRTFELNEGETLLDGAARSGIHFDYSCRTGRCRSCLAHVSSGTTLALHQEVALPEEDARNGWILTCVRTAQSDVVLDVKEAIASGFVPQTYPCRISSISHLSTNVVKVELRLPPSVDFQYRPGQYIQVIGQNGLRRSYSIANTPRPDRLLELHIRRAPGGLMSEYWFGLARANDLLRIHGPLGTFFMRDNFGMDVVFLATGTGIAPIKAMVERLAELPTESQPPSIRIYWGARHAEDIYWRPAAIPRATYFYPLLSQVAPGWMGGRGYVQDQLLSDTPNLSNTLVYACGSEAMIDSARRKLSGAGLPAERFLSDTFVYSG